MLGFTPTTSLAGSEEKLGTNPQISQRRVVDYVRSPSSQQWSCSTLSMTRERLSRIRTVRRKHTRDVRGLAWEVYVACWSGFLL
jgi:hypothetical protein